MIGAYGWGLTLSLTWRIAYVSPDEFPLPVPWPGAPGPVEARAGPDRDPLRRWIARQRTVPD